MNKFCYFLENIIYPESKTSWNISGILKGRLNQHLKFDTSSLSKVSKNDFHKLFSPGSKADKIVIEGKNNWYIIDTKEFIKYMKDHDLKEINLEDLISKLEWNIILPKK